MNPIKLIEGIFTVLGLVLLYGLIMGLAQDPGAKYAVPHAPEPAHYDDLAGKWISYGGCREAYPTLCKNEPHGAGPLAR